MNFAEAIRTGEIIAFTYDGLPREVQPATYGRSTTGKMALRACQVGGSSRRNALPCWELYTEAKIEHPTATGERFTEFAIPGYKRGDSAFVEIIQEH